MGDEKPINTGVNCCQYMSISNQCLPRTLQKSSKLKRFPSIPLVKFGTRQHVTAKAVPSQVVRMASVDMLRGNRSRKPSNLRHEPIFDIQKAVKRCWTCAFSSKIDNPYLLLLNVPQILKTTRFILGNFRLSNLIFNWSPFENKLTMKVPFEGITPQE